MNKKTFKEEKIEFLDYMLAKVLYYTEFDYNAMKVNKTEGPYKVKYRGETMMVDSWNEVDYIDLHADERIATTSRLIPMMNACDSVRVSMGAKMSKQAISVQKAEPPLIATGHENIKDQSPLAMTWKEDVEGEVIKSDEFKGVIEIKKADGKTVKVHIPTPIYAQKRTSIQFHAAKVGQKLKKGDLIYRSVNLAGDGQLQLGVNAYAAFMYWRGYDFEDSMTISEAFAQRLTHLGEYQMYYDVKEGEVIDTIVEPGQVVSSLNRDNLITIERELTLNRAQEGLKNLIHTTSTHKKVIGFKVPNNIIEALVVDVKYIEVKKDVNMLEKLKPVVNKDYRSSSRSDYGLFNKKYGDFPAREIMLPDNLPRGEDKGVNYRVYFKIVIASPAKEGDKITNRFGSKGVIGKVVPNAEMPRNEEGQIVDVIINPSSVIARKNLPQVAEANLSRVSTELWERVDRMPKNKDSYKNIQDLLSRYHFNWLSAKSFSDFYEYHDSLKSTKNKYQVRTGSFSPYAPARVAEIMNELGLSDTEVLFDGLRGRKIKNEIQTGQVYIMKLHHMSEFQNKVTTDNPKDKNPLVLGLGETRQTGQKIGKFMPLYAVMHIE
jgi:DNA-directed RNA polymerase subunit beta